MKPRYCRHPLWLYRRNLPCHQRHCRQRRYRQLHWPHCIHPSPRRKWTRMRFGTTSTDQALTPPADGRFTLRPSFSTSVRRSWTSLGSGHSSTLSGTCLPRPGIRCKATPSSDASSRKSPLAPECLASSLRRIQRFSGGTIWQSVASIRARCSSKPSSAGNNRSVKRSRRPIRTSLGDTLT